MKIIEYLFPRRGIHQVPRTISAEYDRTEMTVEQRLVLAAGLARDPDAAQRKWDRLHRLHGDAVLKHIRLVLRRQRSQTFRERFWMLMRRMLGESEFRMIEKRKPVEGRVLVGFAGFEDET